LLRARKPRPRQAGFSCWQKNREIQEIIAMPFQKGESGNLAGRPRGARNRTTVLLENLLAEGGEAIARKAIELAKAGEIAALRMCLDRLLSVRKDEPVVFDLPPLDTAADSVAAAASWARSRTAISRHRKPWTSPR
jgi:hypothetical protein